MDSSYRGGVFTFTTNGKPHIEIEREYWQRLEAVRKKALEDARRVLRDEKGSAP